MKKYLLIFCLTIFSAVCLFAQEEQPQNNDKGGKLQQRMKEYVQKRLNLSKSEAEKFSPLFLRYIVELRRTHRDNKEDRPVLQLRVAELRVKFRDQFRQIMDEQRANRVFEYQGEFERIVKDELKARNFDRPRRFRSMVTN
jgi:hypothetical protein